MDWRSGEVEWFELNGPANASVNVRVRGEMPRQISLDARGRYRRARGGEFDRFRT
jgi:hypothetical protein